MLRTGKREATARECTTARATPSVLLHDHPKYNEGTKDREVLVKDDRDLSPSSNVLAVTYLVVHLYSISHHPKQSRCEKAGE